MSLGGFLKDRIPLCMLHLLCMLVLGWFLINIGNSINTVFLILVFWIFILVSYWAIYYYRRKKYFIRLVKQVEDLEQKYLIAEIMDKPYNEEDLQFYRVLRLANKSMIENITSIKNERQEYKEYIEQWVHEAKMPLAAMKLICENNKSSLTRKILLEVEKNEHFVEQALFYARSEQVEKDYLIKEIGLQECMQGVIIRNKQLLLQNHIGVEVEETSLTAYTDSKWVEFILNQLVLNAIKYRKEENAFIRLSARLVTSGVALIIEDNGIGIDPSEIERVFEKGFTGCNGREEKKSTGIGLYLCKKLCDKLGIEIKITSKRGEYTRILLVFPKGTFIKMQG